MTDEIIKQMAEIEGVLLVESGPSDYVYLKNAEWTLYNPLDLSQLGRLVEKFDLWVMPKLVTEKGIYKCKVAGGKGNHEFGEDPDLMVAACKAIIAAHGEKSDE